MQNRTIERLKKMSIGLRTEVFLNHFLLPWFLGYWAFPNPKFKGEEIADAFLLWGDVIFIIQIKARESEKTDIN